MESKSPIIELPNSLLSKAVGDHIKSGKEKIITIWLNGVKDDSYRASYFIRSFNEMPEYEQIALSLCEGSILDIGAGAGAHSAFLTTKNKMVTALESDSGFVTLLSLIPNATVVHQDLFNYKPTQTFDTILLLMNGLGISQSVSKLPEMFDKLAVLLSEKGKILVEITDYKHSPEYGPETMYNPEVTFRLMYNKKFSEEFTWLYPDLEMVTEQCERLNLKNNIIYHEDETLLLEISK